MSVLPWISGNTMHSQMGSRGSAGTPVSLTLVVLVMVDPARGPFRNPGFGGCDGLELCFAMFHI